MTETKTIFSLFLYVPVDFTISFLFRKILIAELGDFLLDLARTIRKLFYRLDRAQQNLDKIFNFMKSFAMKPILARKDNRNENTLVNADVNKYMNKRYDKIKQIAEDLPGVLGENYRWLFGLYPDSKYDTDSVMGDGT